MDIEVDNLESPSLNGYTIDWLKLKAKHDSLRAYLQECMNRYMASGQGDDDVKQGTKFGADFYKFVDEPHQWYAYQLFVKHDLFASCLERMAPEASASSTTPSLAPTPKSRKSKPETEAVTLADQYFAKKVEEQNDVQYQGNRRKIVMAEADSSMMGMLSDTGEKLLNYLKQKQEYEGRGEPAPPVVSSMIAILQSLFDKYQMELQCSLVTCSVSPPSAPSNPAPLPFQFASPGAGVALRALDHPDGHGGPCSASGFSSMAPPVDNAPFPSVVASTRPSPAGLWPRGSLVPNQRALVQ